MAFSSPPTSPNTVRAELNTNYDQLIASGAKHPLTSTSFGWGLFVLFLFFLIPPTSRIHNRLTRCSVFAIVLLWHTYMVTCFQARSQAIEYGIGIASAWGTLWAATLLVFKDSKVDFRRIEQRVASTGDVSSTVQTSNSANDNTTEKGTGGNDRSLRRRAQPGSTQKSLIGIPAHQGDPAELQDADIQYIWQSYPTDTFWHRLCWVADILTNFRGVGWDWRISGLPSLPSHVQRSLQRTDSSTSTSDDELKDVPLSRTGLRRFDTLGPLIQHNLSLFFQGYLTIDLLLTPMHHDAFFYTGLASSPPPAYLRSILSHLPFASTLTPIVLTSTRLLISMLMVSTCLRTIFTLAPLVFVGLLSKRHSILRSTPLRNVAFFESAGEPFLYPDAFGSYSMVFSRGLAGWWGGWWHQIFRYAFQAAGEFGLHLVNTGAARLGMKGRIEEKSAAGKALSIAIVFFVSGCVHASGSMTQIRETTRPWSGCFAFFMVQGLGVMVEGWARQILLKSAWGKSLQGKVPGWVGGVVNFVGVHVWFYWTAGLLVDDFARSGLWCFEPVMISVFRGLGLGVEGDGWFCWGGWRRAFWWHADRKWWLSGIAF